jgi:hypothetical protein
MLRTFVRVSFIIARTKGFRVAYAAGAPQTAKNCAAKAAEH